MAKFKDIDDLIDDLNLGADIVVRLDGKKYFICTMPDHISFGEYNGVPIKFDNIDDFINNARIDNVKIKDSINKIEIISR